MPKVALTTGSYYHPVMQSPTNPNKNLVTKEEEEIVVLISGSAALILSSSNISQMSQVALSLNVSVGTLGTVAVEVSPDNTNWETFDDGTFSGLVAAALTSSQISNNSRSFVRVRSTDTPVTSTVTASLNANNG